MVRREYDDGDGLAPVGKIDPMPVKPKEKTFSVPASSRRHRKSQDKWNATDLGYEFAARVKDRYPNLLAQANPVKCAKVFGSVMKTKNISGTTMHAAMDIFFEDERNFRDVGSGSPIWLRFLGAFPSIQAMAERKANQESGFDWESEARGANR